MSSRGKLALVALAVIGVVIGLWLGVCGRSSNASHDAGVVVVDAGQVAIAPKIVDAGTVAVMPPVVDAGEAEVPLVAPKEHGHRDASTGASREKHEKIARAEAPKPEKPKEEPKPEVHDAGTPVAAVVDAGSAPAAAKSTHVDVQPDAMPSAPVTIAYTDQLSAWLKLTQVRVFVDGKRVADEHNDNGIDLTKARVLYSGGVFPGTHQVRVESVYFGKGNGLFSYMEGYRFRVPQMAVVQIPEGKKVRVDAVAYDKGALEQWENRPAMKLDVKVE